MGDGKQCVRKLSIFLKNFHGKIWKAIGFQSTFALCCISIAAEWRAFLLARVYTGIATFYEMGYC
ncbi:MAG: hypothetical protein AL399_07720 [Candidatus [Bacteroides] periocalifornicus]|uniref:Uncharacterized protein n=1 Tax=Candidatus [Bacteroides] periocalifornicus TaxID=1702214 RepID=A0A0Q4B5T4_9BACT|nr:MAG: hypothetical protein AL399_07720 [Candidatus [Bacteroides] periocalifornicus]